MTNKFLVHVLQFIFSVTSVLYDKKRWIYEKKTLTEFNKFPKQLRSEAVGSSYVR